MPYAIDGSNLGGALAGSAGARDRETVVRRLLSWGRGRQVVVVFDGPGEPTVASSYGDLRIRFSGARSADAVLLELIARRPRDWIVVTDDRELASACRDAGARVQPARELAAALPSTSGEGRDPGGAAEPVVDVDEWEAFFRHEKDR